MYLIGFMMVGSLVFQSIGKATESFVTSIARPVLFLLPLIFTLPRFIGFDGLMISFPISDFLTFLLTVVLLIPVIRQLQKSRRQLESGETQPVPEQLAGASRGGFQAARAIEEGSESK